MSFRTLVLFFVNDGGYPFIPQLDIGMDTFGSPMVGNSAQAFNIDRSGSEYILGPGFDYWMEYRIEAWIDNAALLDTDPPPVLTFEFGGLSHGGVDVSLIGVPLPEPSSAAMAAAALLAGGGLRCSKGRVAANASRPELQSTPF